MIAAAVEAVRDGREVHMIASPAVERIALREGPSEVSKIKFEAYIPADFNWVIMRRTGSSENAVWFVDHHLIECDRTFLAMCKAVTAFNETTEAAQT